MDRRSFLLLGMAALGLGGCTRSSSDPGPPSGGTSAPLGPDEPAAGGRDPQIRAEVAAAELALIDLYRSAATAMPRRAASLRPLLDQHIEHLARVSPQTVPAASAQPLAGSPSSPAPSSPAPSSPGAQPAPVTLADLIAAEAATQGQHAVACAAAEDPALVRELCLMSASEAQHGLDLDRLRTGAGRT